MSEAGQSAAQQLSPAPGERSSAAVDRQHTPARTEQRQRLGAIAAAEVDRKTS
ncbi:hypothetical protein HC891_26735 [Candidatus Gracilibacteria bacterium]|nr:hypothetical protein [Candidatus Gracilibacteria bacterium]